MMNTAALSEIQMTLLSPDLGRRLEDEYIAKASYLFLTAPSMPSVPEC